MKRLLLAGLGPHEAAAMGIMLRMQWRDMEIVDLGRSADFELPQQGLVARACEGVVVDLHGVGLRCGCLRHFRRKTTSRSRRWSWRSDCGSRTAHR